MRSAVAREAALQVLAPSVEACVNWSWASHAGSASAPDRLAVRAFGRGGTAGRLRRPAPLPPGNECRCVDDHPQPDEAAETMGCGRLLQASWTRLIVGLVQTFRGHELSQQGISRRDGVGQRPNCRGGAAD